MIVVLANGQSTRFSRVTSVVSTEPCHSTARVILNEDNLRGATFIVAIVFCELPEIEMLQSLLLTGHFGQDDVECSLPYSAKIAWATV